VGDWVGVPTSCVSRVGGSANARSGFTAETYREVGVSDSFKGLYRVAGSIVLALALCVALVTGLAACGGDEATDSTVEVTTPDVESTDATVAVDETAGNEGTAAIDPALVGKWYSAAETDTLEFTSDGLMSSTDDAGVDSYQATYAADGSSFIFSREGSEDMSVVYSVDGDVLTLGDPAAGETLAYQRVVE
jgi:hypothetical protein